MREQAAHLFESLNHLFVNGAGDSVLSWVVLAALLVALYGLARHNDRQARLRAGSAFPDAHPTVRAGQPPGLPEDDEEVSAKTVPTLIHLWPQDRAEIPAIKTGTRSR